MKRVAPLLTGLLIAGIGGFVFVRSQLALRVQLAVDRVEVMLSPPEEVLTEERIGLTLIDREGLERTVFYDLELPTGSNRRYRAILDALQRAMEEAGVWVAGVRVQEVFLVERTNERVAVIDMAVDAQAAASVQEELAMLEALRQTLQRNNIDSMRVFVNGQAADTFLGHIAVLSDLD